MTRIHPTHHRTSNDVAWKTLLEIATLVRTSAPWTNMEFVPPIAVEDAGGGETAYCTLARSPGHSCVFMVYLGTSGLTLWRDDLLGNVDPDSPVERAGLEGIEDPLDEVQLLVRRFHGYLINFNERGTPAIHRRHRLPQAKTENPDEKTFPSFEVVSYPKGEDSREPAPAELQRVGEILLQLQSVADSVREEGETFMASREVGELWHLSPTFDPETREVRWHGEWRPSPVSIQEIEDQRLAIEADMFKPFEETAEERTYEVEEKERRTWISIAPALKGSEGGLILVTTPGLVRVSSENAALVHRRALGFFTVPDIGFSGAVVLDDPEEDPVEFRMALLEMMIAREERPSMVIVSDRRHASFLKPMSLQFGFRLICEEMPEEMRCEIAEAVAAQIALVADGKVEEGEVGVTMKRGGKTPAMRPPSKGLKDVILHLEGFCSEHFTPTLYQNALDLATHLDLVFSPSPLEQGSPESWASAIASHVVRSERIVGTDPEKRVTTEEICDWFGVPKSTLGKRLKTIKGATMLETQAI